jgi:F-type H+-transporting ATPase subunit delta
LAGNIARRYAQAIFNVLGDPDQVERVEGELTAFRKILGEVPSLGRMVVHPGVPLERRNALLDQVLGQMDCHGVTRGTIGLMVQQRQLRQLGAVVEAFGKLREEKLNVARALVTTALPLDHGDRSSWEEALAKAAGKPVRIEYNTDPSLIGGAVARIGSVLYDGSVRGSLEKIRQSLLGD